VRGKEFGEPQKAGEPTIVFSNEVADAFPVHRFAWDASERKWFEWGVTCAEDGFDWIRLSKPAVDIEQALSFAGFEIPAALRSVLPDRFVLEVAPLAAQWWSDSAKPLEMGKLLTIDYGATAEELLRPERVGGTLRGFFQHHGVADVLARPGEQDLTAHVNFTQLKLAGERAGLKTEAFVSQERFLSDVLRSMLADPATAAKLSSQELRAFQRLTHPDHLGHSFRVLIQSR
jgi:SAM-dependent MidA family methyltransferase